MLSVDRPSSFVSPSLNDIILKSPSHPFPFIATTSLSRSLLWCIPPLIPSSKSPDDLSEMASPVNWRVKGRWLYSIHSQSWCWRWSCAAAPALRIPQVCRAVSSTTVTCLINKILHWQVKYNQAGLSFRVQMKCIITTRDNTAPVDPPHNGGKMTISSATCDILNNWTTPSNWFHPLTHTWVSHSYHQQTSPRSSQRARLQTAIRYISWWSTEDCLQ